MMTDKERMLKAARGEWADRLPWIPRIDLWYNANSLQGTLPAKYGKEATLDEIADDIGGGHHKIVPEYKRSHGVCKINDYFSSTCECLPCFVKCSLNLDNVSLKDDGELIITSISTTMRDPTSLSII